MARGKNIRFGGRSGKGVSFMGWYTVHKEKVYNFKFTVGTGRGTKLGW